VVRPSRVREGYNGRNFDFSRLRLHFCGKPNGHSHAWLNLHGGGQVDYTNTRPGDFLNINAGLWYRFGRHLYVEPDYTRERMTVADAWLYTSSIGQLTASWQFNPRLFIRAILQYVDDEFNAEFYGDDRDSEERLFFAQFLFSYKLNPRTVFFVGYSDNSSATQDYALTLSDRTLFVKIGYAWVL
jgi:predicted porin